MNSTPISDAKNEPVCCSYLDCKSYNTRPMVKDGPAYVSEDGELLFCEEHNPIVSGIYNQYKSLVDWMPTRISTHINITIEYKFWSIPRCLALRKEYSKLCKPTIESSRHRHYEVKLHEQFEDVKSIIDGYSEEKLHALLLFLQDNVPVKYHNVVEEEIDWNAIVEMALGPGDWQAVDTNW